MPSIIVESKLFKTLKNLNNNFLFVYKLIPLMVLHMTELTIADESTIFSIESAKYIFKRSVIGKIKPTVMNINNVHNVYNVDEADVGQSPNMRNVFI